MRIEPSAPSQRPIRPMAADLYGDLLPVERLTWRAYLPGLTLVAAATLAATYLSDRYGAPLTLMALLIGLSLNSIGTDRKLAPGLGFSAGALLRLGIVLLGTRVTLAQIAHLGPIALLAIIVIVAVTILTGVLAARLFGVDNAIGTLAGAAVAICGASAALAVATTLGDRHVSRSQLAQVLVGIAVMSASAMFAYPIVAHSLGLNDRQAGFLFGASIHDVAQALGAGYSYSPAAGQSAAIVKLTRVALLAPALMAIGAMFPSGGTRFRIAPPPLFVIGFFATAAINSTGLIPPWLLRPVEFTASMLLAAAVAATGIRAPLASLREGGFGLIRIIAAATGVSFLVSLCAALWLVR